MGMIRESSSPLKAVFLMPQRSLQKMGQIPEIALILRLFLAKRTR
jgi:hypothetical protein